LMFACFCSVSLCMFLYGLFCHDALTLDMSTLCTTFFCEHLLNLYYTKPLQRSKLKQCFTVFTGCDQHGFSIGRRGKISAWTVLNHGRQWLKVTKLWVQQQHVPKLKKVFLQKRYLWSFYRQIECVKTGQDRWGLLTRLKHCLQHLPRCCKTYWGLLSSWFLLGSIPYYSTNHALCRWLWMDKKKWTRPVVIAVDDLLPAGKACIKLIKCEQDKWCRGRCSCIKADIIVCMWWSVCKDWKG